MAATYFVLFLLLLVASFLATVRSRQSMFEFPALMGFAFAAFILPQAVSLVRFPGAVEMRAVESVLLMSCLCLGACVLGYRLSPSTRLIHWATQVVEIRRLFHVGVAFVAMSYLFHWALLSTDVQFTEAGGMTGRSTVLLFFQQLCYPGFAICLFCAIRRPSLMAVLAALCGLWPLLQAVLLGRREGTASLVLIVLLALFFERKWVPRRWLFVAGLGVSILVIPATGAYRALAREMGTRAIWKVDFLWNFKIYLTEESPVLELRNAAVVIDSTRSNGDYQYGADYWNHLVFRFVPAQLLGTSFKEALKLRPKGPPGATDATSLTYEFSTGSTVTGMADSFQQFGWFGCLFFVFMAVVFRSLWGATQGPDALFARLLYTLSCTSAMRAVTHWTLDFLPGILYSVFFLSLAMLYAGSPHGIPRSSRTPGFLTHTNKAGRRIATRTR
jgi:hypothetical protein